MPRYDVYSDRVSAAFVVSDPVDWGRDIQVCFQLSFLFLFYFCILFFAYSAVLIYWGMLSMDVQHMLVIRVGTCSGLRNLILN